MGEEERGYTWSHIPKNLRRKSITTAVVGGPSSIFAETDDDQLPTLKHNGLSQNGYGSYRDIQSNGLIWKLFIDDIYDAGPNCA